MELNDLAGNIWADLDFGLRLDLSVGGDRLNYRIDCDLFCCNLDSGFLAKPAFLFTNDCNNDQQDNGG